MKFEVNTSQLENMVTSCEDKITYIDSERNQLYNALHSLDAMWQGSSHDAFVKAYETDHESMTDLIRDLQRVMEDMGKARAEYDKAEDDILNQIKSIRI